MMKYLKYYIVLIPTLSVVIGLILGGTWMWLGFSVLFIVVIGGDAVMGEDASRDEYGHPWLVELPLHLAFPFVSVMVLCFAWSCGTGNADFLGIGRFLSSFFRYDFILARNASVWSDYIGGLIGVGFMVAGYGTNVGHELTHRINAKFAMMEGRWLLAVSCNADFAIEHVYGHHVTVGTDEDPATAKKGENVYAFFIRSTVFGHMNAWKHELKRLRKKGFNCCSLNNKMITGYIMSLLWCIIFFFAGEWFGVLLFLGQAVFAKFILEIVNYMEHYGLVRSTDQPIRPEHSWNTNKRMSTMILFSLTRHSAHHENPKVRFWKLDPYENAPQMPYGYLTTLIICLIPPLWYHIIGPSLNQWEENYAAIE